MRFVVGIILLFLAAQTASAAQPNVILILADDLALGDLSFLNGGKTRTPNLDRLFRESVTFTRAYSASPVCAPARAALFTGRYPHRTGCVTLNMEKYPEISRIKLGETTIADLFKAGGYATGLVGKWHSGEGKAYHPTRRGFDEFQGFIGADKVKTYFDYLLEMDGAEERFDSGYLTDDLTDRAIDFVTRHKEHPFFLHLAHYAPHRPLSAPEELVQSYMKAGLDEKIAKVYAMVEVLDLGIGKLLRSLDELGLKENTLVFFASDNGPDPIPGHRFNLNMRGMKYEVHEGGIHVPMAFHWPGTLSPGIRNQVIQFIDILPTLAEFCDVPVPSGLAIDGISFAGVVRDNDGAPERDLYWQWNRKEPLYEHNAALRDGPWKLVRPFITRNIPKPDTEEPPVLYDLSNDPGETIDVASKFPRQFREMRDRLEAWAEEVEKDRLDD